MKLAALVALLGPLAVFYISGMSDHMTITSLKMHREMLHALVQDHYLLAVCYYIGVYTAFGAISLPCISFITMAGGFLFGTLAGSLYTIIGATIGGSIAFLMYRYFFGPKKGYSIHLLHAFGHIFEQSTQARYYLVVHVIIFVDLHHWRTSASAKTFKFFQSKETILGGLARLHFQF